MRGLVLALAVLSGGCQGQGGAVSVRWEIVDLTTGQSFNPRDVALSDGSCAHEPPRWSVECVQLVLADPAGDAPSVLDAGMPAPIQFSCSAGEATTPFSLPTGRFAVSLRAYSANTQLVTPAPAVREIIAGQVVNLEVVEIGVDPLPTAPAPGGSGGGVAGDGGLDGTFDAGVVFCHR